MNHPLAPLDYSILFIFVYLRYCMVRLINLRPWVLKWQMPEMFAGVPGVGAEDAWWLTSILLEHCRLHQCIFSGMCADIMKCFDQIVKPLLKTIPIAAGMPSKVVNAYMKFHEQVYIYNQLAGGLDKPYRKRCSIPQGCPFSMMFIALLLYPWVCLCKEMGLKLRVLADDLLLVSVGNEACVFKKIIDVDL